MVALVWDAGRINAAVDLEALWNELGSVLPFSLWCACTTHSIIGQRTVPTSKPSVICNRRGRIRPLGHPDYLDEQEPNPAA